MSKQECSHPNPDLFITPPYCKKIENHDESIPEETRVDDEASVAKIEISNPGKILHLVESLTEGSTKRLEVKFNTYVSKTNIIQTC